MRPVRVVRLVRPVRVVRLVRLSRASISCICVPVCVSSVLSCAAHITPLHSFKHVKRVNSFKRLVYAVRLLCVSVCPVLSCAVLCCPVLCCSSRASISCVCLVYAARLGSSRLCCSSCLFCSSCSSLLI